MATVTIVGRVIQPGTSDPGVLRVEILARGSQRSELLLTVDTQPDGTFEVEVDRVSIPHARDESSRVLEIRVLRDGEPVQITRGQEAELRWSARVDLTIEVAGTDSSSVLIIRGQVSNLDGAVLPKMEMLALRLMVQGKEKELARATTDAAGKYSIDCAQALPPSPTVITVSAGGAELTRSNLICDTSGNVVCDIVVNNDEFRSPPEYTRLTAALAPLIDEVPPKSLSDDDLKILQCALRQPADQLSALRAASLIVDGSTVPAGAVYGLIRQGLSPTRQALLAQSAQVLTANLTAAVNARVAPALTADQIEAAVREMADLRVSDVLAADKPEGLSKLLTWAVPDQTIQASIVRAYSDYQGDPDTFWSTTLSTVNGLSEADVRSRVELVAGIGALTFGHPPLAGALLAPSSPVKIEALRDLAKLQVADWKTLIASNLNGVVVGVPAGVTGSTDAEKVDQFAQAVAQTVAANMPTSALAAALARTGDATLQGAGALLDGTPDFELAGAPVSKQFPPPANATPTQMAALAALTQVQRLFKLTPNADEVVALHQGGFASSWDVARATPQDLVSDAGFAIARAQALQQLATARVETVLGVIGKFGAQAVGAATPAVPTVGSVATAGQKADLVDLFGQETLCTCEEFRSLDGYWSYFASCMYFLPGYARAELKKRRPDLWGLRFSRANAETDDRYLSLVLEVLESAVISRRNELADPLNPPQYVWPSNQTTYTQDQLAAAPQYMIDCAYTLLADPEFSGNTVYPLSLPFDFYAAQANAFSGLLGVTRGDLMEALQNRTQSAALSPPTDAIAREWLGVPVAAWSLLTNTANPQPSSAGLDITKPGNLLNIIGITPAALVTLFNCRFINPPDVPFAQRVGLTLDGTCNADSSNAAITNLGGAAASAAFFGRVARFIRLWRTLGWPMADVDLAIWQLSRATLDEASLVQIAALARLRTEVTLPIAELLAWWQDIDSVQDSDQPSQLTSVFPALTVGDGLAFNPVAPVPWNSALPGLLSWVITDPDPSKSQVPAILSGLDITAGDLALLLTSPPPASIHLPDLSALYRQVSMARWLKLDIKSFLALQTLIDVQPFKDVLESRRFLKTVARLRASAFSLSELLYLLGGQIADDAPSSFIVTADQATDFGTQMRTLLAPMPGDPTKQNDAVVAKVAAYFSIAPAVATVLLSAPFKATGGLVPSDYLVDKLTDDSYWIAPAPNTGTAPGALTDLTNLMIQLGRQALFASRSSFTADELGRLTTLAVKTGSGWLDLTQLPQPPAAPATFEMLEPWLAYQALARSQPPLAPPLLNVLDGAGVPPQLQWSDIATCLQCDAGDLASIATQVGIGTAAGLQDVRSLQRVIRSVRALERASLNVVTAIQWIAEPVLSTTSDNIVSAARACVGEQNWSAAAQPLRNQLLVRQRDALLAYLFGAGLPGDGTTTSFPDSDDVRDYYLVDPMMGPEFITTRLELALQSVQLFTDRCFRGQEPINAVPKLALGDALAEQWKTYQGSYRYWQAAVDIWLGPWAVADFSFLDRSNERYESFTQALAQHDVTKDTVADALENYLHALADISNLEIAGYYEETEAGQTPVLHVVGRTSATPATYYYARRDGADWSPWQKVSADINAGDSSVMIVVFHRKLFVIWPVFTTKAYEPRAGKVPKPGDAAPPPPESYCEVQIGWTVLKNGVWSAKRISDTILSTDWPDQPPAPADTDRIIFRAGLVPAIDDAMQQQLRVSLTLYPTQKGGPVIANTGPVSYVAKPEFGFTSCSSAPVIHRYGRLGENYDELPSTIAWNGFLLSSNDRRVSTPNLKINGVLASTPSGLTLYEGESPGLPNEDTAWPSVSTKQLTALQAKISTYQLLFSAQFSQPVAQSFFFKDDRWSFFAEYLPLPPNPRISTVVPNVIYGPAAGKLSPTTLTGLLASGFLDEAINKIDATYSVTALAATLSSLENGREAGLSQTWSSLPRPKKLSLDPRYRFYTFCHPTVCSFLEALDGQGLSGLLRRDPNYPIQKPAPPSPEFFNARYQSNPGVVDNASGHLPNPGVEFTTVNPFGQDNQNLFYYCVGAAAVALTAAGRFDDAEWMWRAIFDPMDGSGDAAPTRYWKYEPLRTALVDSIDDLYGLLNADPDIAAQTLNEVKAWTAAPFDPWAVAAGRPVALMKIAVRFFLINWLTQADQDYAQAADQETLMRAADGYIRALEILGPEPQPLEPTRPAQDSPNNYHCFSDIENASPANASLPEILESALPPLQNAPSSSPTLPADRFPWSTAANIVSVTDPVSGVPALLFCIPSDTSFDQLRQWATTKINNIRAGLDFNGQPHVYSIYGARIDPALLARAAAAGIDLASATIGVITPPRFLRFPVLLQRAKEFVAELEKVSGSLLGALTEDSAETLNELRAAQEVTLLAMTLAVKQQAVTEAQQTLVSLQTYQQVLQARYQYYSSRQMISPGEGVALSLTEAATILQAVAGTIGMTSGEVTAIPNFTTGMAGIGGTPMLTVTEGGGNIGGGLSAVSRALDLAATLLHAQAGAIATVAGYQRRMDEWQMLAQTTNLELTQVAAQIGAQQARVAAVTADLAAFEQQQANAGAVQAYLASRVNNVQFRAFRINQLSSVAHQGYLLAYSLAKAAEGAYQFERFPGSGSPPSFVQFGYWQNNYNGMTAAEQLSSALQQIEFAWSTQDPGDKPWPAIALSLAMIAPGALESLRRTGDSGPFKISELQFLRIRSDAYFLRIRRLRVRVPNVSGPYTPLLFKVEMMSQGLRVTGDIYADPAAAAPLDPAIFYIESPLPQPEIMYTTGRTDEAEPAPIVDGQYRPFEGFGVAESTFQVSFPAAMAALYGATIADVIFEFELTSRIAQPKFCTGAVNELTGQLLMQLQRVTTDYPNQWYRATSAAPAATLSVTIPLAADRFPYAGDNNVTIETLAVMAVWKTTSSQAAASGAAISVTLGGTALNAQAAAPNPFAGISTGSVGVFQANDYVIAATAAAPVPITVTLDASKLPAEWTSGANVAVGGLLDLVVLATYSID